MNAQEPARTPAQQIAELLGISLAEAQLSLKLAKRVQASDDKILPFRRITETPEPANSP